MSKRTFEETLYPLNFFFFIGRLNPPHSGHIHALTQLINAAKANGTRAYILLGEGPGGGARTLDNPITFELKSSFLRDKLKSMGYSDEEFIFLPTIGGPIEGVHKMIDLEFSIYKELHGEQTPEKVNAYLFVGGKDEDAIKHAGYIFRPFEKLKDSEDFMFSENIVTVSPELVGEDEPMSATKVRKDVYRLVLSNDLDKMSRFSEKYGFFYNIPEGGLLRQDVNYSNDMFTEMENISKIYPDSEVDYYIVNGKMPKLTKTTSTRKSTKKGGTTKRSRNSSRNRSRTCNHKRKTKHKQYLKTKKRKNKARKT